VTRSGSPVPRAATLPESATPGIALVIDAPLAVPIIHAHPRKYSVVLARFSAVDAHLLARVSPECILFPLFGSDFDATHVIERLLSLGYRGHMCVVTGALPAPQMVQPELRALARVAALDLVPLPD
jgi:hypothetical protein